MSATSVNRAFNGLVEARPVKISEEHVRRYEEDGAIYLRGLFSTEIIETLREATAQILAGKSMDMTHKNDKGKFVSGIPPKRWVWSQEHG